MPRCILKPGFHHYRVELYEDTRYRGARRWYATVWRGGFYARGFGQWVDGVCCTMDTWRPDCDLCGQTAAVAVSKARHMAREWVRWQLALGRDGRDV